MVLVYIVLRIRDIDVALVIPFSWDIMVSRQWGLSVQVSLLGTVYSDWISKKKIISLLWEKIRGKKEDSDFKPKSK